MTNVQFLKKELDLYDLTAKEEAFIMNAMCEELDFMSKEEIEKSMKDQLIKMGVL